MMEDRLTKESLGRALCGLADGWRLDVRASSPSTNAAAREYFSEHELAAPVLFAAEAQTAGRGRLGRGFHSPSGGVYFSLLYPLADVGELRHTVTVTSAAAVAVRRAILAKVGVQTEIKWVNDLLHRGKKVCGILAEAVSLGQRAALILGIGINLRPMEFPPELSGIAGSLNDTELPRAELISAILWELMPFLRDPASTAWLEDYRRYSCVIGRSVTWQRGQETAEGIAVGIEPDGGLTVQKADGELETLRSGEITLRLRE